MLIEQLTIEDFLQICEKDGSLLLGAGEPTVTFSQNEQLTAPIGKALIEKRQAPLRISTRLVDRKNHIVNPRGGSIEHFRYNPVLMWNHDGYKNPNHIIGKALTIKQTDNYIEALVEYAHLEFNKVPDQLWELEKKGLLPGNSIGLRPTGKITREENGIITIGEWELLDISKVAIPINATATNKLIIAQ